MPLHVSSTCAHHQEVKMHYTASGIITPTGGSLVHETVTRDCVMHFDLLMMSTCARNM